MNLKHISGRAFVSSLLISTLVWTSAAPVAFAADQIITPPVAAPSAPAAGSNSTVQTPATVVPVPSNVRIPEGTEIHVHLNEALSSATASSGDTFSIASDEEIRLADGTVIPAGYSGKGEVTQAEKSGMLGKPGQLSIKLNFLKVGGVHVHLRATKTNEGKSNVTTMVVTTVLLSGLGLFIHGHSIVYPKGQPMVAYVDEDAAVALPLAPPPQSD